MNRPHSRLQRRSALILSGSGKIFSGEGWLNSRVETFELHFRLGRLASPDSRQTSITEMQLIQSPSSMVKKQVTQERYLKLKK